MYVSFVTLMLLMFVNPGSLQCTIKGCDVSANGCSQLMTEISSLKKQSRELLATCSGSGVQRQSGETIKDADNTQRQSNEEAQKQNNEILRMVNNTCTKKQSSEILKAIHNSELSNTQNSERIIQMIVNLQARLGTSDSTNLSPCVVSPATTVCQPCSVSKTCTSDTTPPPTSLAPLPVPDIPYNSSWTDCEDVYKSGHNESGVYKVKPKGLSGPVNVYCDASAGGGWTVLQRHKDGSVPFNRTWNEYRNGFGDLNGEFWMGNELMHIMTTQHPEGNNLMVNRTDFTLNRVHTKYNEFYLGSEGAKYQLYIGGMISGLYNALSANSDKPFSTWDKDNDVDGSKNCAKSKGGGWWFYGCGSYAFLNGQYSQLNKRSPDHIVWREWGKGDWRPMKECEMKFRSVLYAN